MMLSDEERDDAEILARGSDGTARRAKIVLMLVKHASWTTIQKKLRCSRATIARVQRNVVAERESTSLYAILMRRRTRGELARDRIVKLAATRRADGSPALSLRAIARRTHVSHVTVRNILIAEDVSESSIELMDGRAESYAESPLSHVDLFGLLIHRGVRAIAIVERQMLAKTYVPTERDFRGALDLLEHGLPEETGDTRSASRALYAFLDAMQDRGAEFVVTMGSTGFWKLVNFAAGRIDVPVCVALSAKQWNATARRYLQHVEADMRAHLPAIVEGGLTRRLFLDIGRRPVSGGTTTWIAPRASASDAT